MASNPLTAFVDVHAHYIPPGYRDALAAAGNLPPDGNPNFPDWDVARTLAVMDRLGVATQMLSVSSPGVFFGDAASARKLARMANEFAARTVADHPKRFGGFASLPLPDVDSALAEIGYALDTLKLDGFVMLTNYGGVYLGDSRLDPVFDELNRRGAAMFIHPTSPACWERTALGYPRPMIEFMFDSTRAVVNLILSGTLERCPNIRVIVPHAGGTLPFLARRIVSISSIFTVDKSKCPAGVMAYLKRLNYDLAASTGTNSLGPLLELVDASSVMFGGDYPFTPEAVVQAALNELKDSPLLKVDDLHAIERGNATRLFPRLQAAASR